MNTKDLLEIQNKYVAVSQISKNGIIECFEIVELTTKNDVKEKKEVSEAIEVKNEIEDVIEEEILDISLEEVDEKILTKTEICSHLDYLITRSKNRKSFENARSKWTEDREHILNYDIDNNVPKIEAKAIKGNKA